MKLGHETRVLLLALAGGLPAVAICVILMAVENHQTRTQITVDSFVIVLWLSFCFAARGRIAGPLRTIANLLEALREGDYSIRARVDDPKEPLGEVMQQVNAMAATLRDQRLGALEATTLLRKVMEEIDVAAFAFDPGQQLRLVNRAGERLLAQPAERLLARDATSLGLAQYLGGAPEQTIQHEFPGSAGRWGIRRSQFREGGLPHQLLVVTDLTRPLREEELQAWQRIVRVIGHELNNSLTPIKSIAQSLAGLLTAEPLPEDWSQDMSRGLGVIATRSESLSRFMSSYARLAKLPPPKLSAIEINDLLLRASRLELRQRVFFEEGQPLTFQGDIDQLEQALINLIQNGVDSAQSSGGRVFLFYRPLSSALEITVRDEGPGLANTANLFVPFFTTKRGGSGIGLVLSRQIAEAHGGSLALRNAAEGSGCEAIITLPIH